jgi:hypothetical protein
MLTQGNTAANPHNVTHNAMSSMAWGMWFIHPAPLRPPSFPPPSSNDVAMYTKDCFSMFHVPREGPFIMRVRGSAQTQGRMSVKTHGMGGGDVAGEELCVGAACSQDPSEHGKEQVFRSNAQNMCSCNLLIYNTDYS